MSCRERPFVLLAEPAVFIPCADPLALATVVHLIADAVAADLSTQPAFNVGFFVDATGVELRVYGGEIGDHLYAALVRCNVRAAGSDQRKACYAAALGIWRKAGSVAGRKPNASAFGLDQEEAADVELRGYDTSILPSPLRPDEGEVPS